MTTMTHERFARIIEAYGADPRRWPDAERAAARAFALAHPGEAQARLAAAAALDACLAGDAVEPPGRALRRRVEAAARGPGRRRRMPLARPRFWWLSGAALAGVGAAGLVAGAVATAFFTAAGERMSAGHEPSYMSTGFDAGGGEESVE